MSFSTLIKERRGRVVMKVLYNKDSETVVLTLDKVLRHRVIRGPALTVPEVESVLGLMAKTGHWRMPSRDRALSGTVLTGPATSEAVSNELLMAIEEARKGTNRANGIRVMPSMPRLSNAHTCPECGCHVASCFSKGPGSELKLCSYCGVAYDSVQRRYQSLEGPG